MRAAFNALFWEILWKNRLVFLALGLLLGAGAALAAAVVGTVAEAPWLGEARSFTAVAFLASLLLGFAPFCLMESAGGWRMNSMITRWFVLPVRTGWLVFVPLVAAVAAVALLVAAWMPILDRVAPGLDSVYLTAVLVVGLVAIHALAWTVPRKPSQFWVGAALLLPVILILAFGPQDQPGNERFRRGALIPLSYATLLLTGFAWYAARRNRCGDWPGELPLDWVWQFLRRGGAVASRRRAFGSPARALFWSDTLPSLRLLGASWYGLVLVLFLYFSLVSLRGQPDLAFSLRLLSFLALNLLPVVALSWLAIWGLFVGCEPSSGCRTRLSAFRATLPVSSGTLAAQRGLTLLLGWGLVSLPTLALLFWHDPSLSGTESSDSLGQLRNVLARFLAVGAHVAVGALPLFLWGRLEGFPNLLLAGMCAWAGAWALGANLSVEGEPGWRGSLAWGLLALKLATAGGAFVVAWRAGHVTWRFPTALVLGWAAVASFLVWGLSVGQESSLHSSLTVVLFVPLARVAWCPVALAANRQR